VFRTGFKTGGIPMKVKTKEGKARQLKIGGGSVKTKEAKPTILNTIFLNLQTSIEECVDIIKAFEEEGYTTYYDSKTKVLKTTVPKTKIKELSKKFLSIQSFNLIDRNPNNSNNATDRIPNKEQE